jgi:hypothetical protein
MSSPWLLLLLLVRMLSGKAEQFSVDKDSFGIGGFGPPNPTDCSMSKRNEGKLLLGVFKILSNKKLQI